VDPGTGEVFNLLQREEQMRALGKMAAGEIEDKLAAVEEAEIKYLQGLSRQERRAALRGRDKVTRDELKSALFNQDKGE
jgi:hypothetical protein